VDAGCKRSERIAHGERSAHRALGVVLVQRRDAEHGNDGVADELLRHAAEPLHLAVHEREHLCLERADVLRVDALAEGGRAGEVCEERRDDAPFLRLVGREARLRRLAERRPARGAERGAGRRLGAARRTRAREPRAARAAEARGRGLRRPAGWTRMLHAANCRGAGEG
jgi:hypothetical protein